MRRAPRSLSWPPFASSSSRPNHPPERSHRQSLQSDEYQRLRTEVAETKSLVSFSIFSCRMRRAASSSCLLAVSGACAGPGAGNLSFSLSDLSCAASGDPPTETHNGPVRTNLFQLLLEFVDLALVAAQEGLVVHHFVDHRLVLDQLRRRGETQRRGRFVRVDEGRSDGAYR